MEDENYWYNDASDYDDLDDETDGDEDSLNQISDADVFMAASFDGDADKTFGNPAGSSYGYSIDLNELTDEQRSLYDSEYYGNIDNRIDDDDTDF